MKAHILIPILALGLACAATVQAQVPQLIGYQGRVLSNGTNFTGSGQFKFALVNNTGATTFWSNNGTSVAGSEPTLAVTLSVSGGLYSVLLGDATLPNMTVIPATVFTNSDVRLRVWFNDGVSGSQLLTPDQRIAAVGYAMMAANIPDGLVTSNKLADGAITTAKLADGAITTAKLGSNVVSSLALADSVELGTTNVTGNLDVYRTSAGTAAISLMGGSSQISTYGSDGLEQIRLWGASFGEIMLNDNTGNDTTVLLSANFNSGGSLTLSHSNSASRVNLSASSTSGDLRLYSTNNLTRTQLHGGSDGSYLTLYAADGSSGVYLDGDDGGGGAMYVRNTNGSNRVFIDGQGNNGGGQMRLYAGDGSSTVNFYGDSSAAAGGGEVSVSNDVGVEGAQLVGYSFGGRLDCMDEAGANTVLIGSSGSSGGFAQFYRADGVIGVRVDGEDSNAGYISVTGTNGISNIILDGRDSSGNGRITCDVLQINGGADLSEQFDINSGATELKPGMIVSIDPSNPGELRLSEQAYDRTVAGIVSGAGGVRPGMLMGQSGTKADGKHPVALTGRVYCYVDADAGGAIQPGDLLTTSGTPGHGMKVTDHTHSQGAIIGKAMTGLSSGKGLVLVLVSLQ